MIAFLVVSHRNPGQVLRLVRALREGEETHVLVHHDQRREPPDRAELAAAGGHLAAYGLSVEWGNAAYTQMLRRALADLHAEVDPDWVAVLSGQDYPLRLGYRYRHYSPPRPLALTLGRAPGPRAYLRELPMGLGMRLGVKPVRHPFGPGLRCYVSSDWLTLERGAVRAILDFARTRKAVMRHYRRTIIPSESLFATVLLNDPSVSVGPASRLLGFEEGSPHPHTFRAQDVERLLESGFHFGRKFDQAVDPPALDLLDRARKPGI